MLDSCMITAEERDYLREIAKQQLEISALDIMAARSALWYDHNALRTKKPLIVMEELSFEHELLPPPRCTAPFAKELETTIQRILVNHALIGDDKVVPAYLPLDLRIEHREFDLDYTLLHPAEESIGFQFQHIIHTLEDDFPKLAPSRYAHDRKLAVRRLEAANGILGDILPVRVENNHLRWHMMPTYKAVKLMGMENLLMEMAMNPELASDFLAFIEADIERYLDWMQQENLLTMNNGNDYTGSGSYGFSDELSAAGRITTKNLWGNMNSQESSGISPAMYEALVFPHYSKLAERFGLVYYGCCEPVHPIWERCISKLPNLRKVSISAWCDEDIMGDYLRDTRVIYSRKPSPNFLGIESAFDEAAFAAYIAKTLTAAKGCVVEFIFRDIYTLCGNIPKAARAVQIVREQIEKHS